MVSGVITIVNLILRTVIQKLSLYEKHDTLTNHRISVALKLIVARFTNTAIIPFIVSSTRDFKDWNEEGGLTSDIFYLIIALAFVDPFLFLVNMGY